MNRKDALSKIALLVGGTVAGAELFLSGCTNGPDQVSAALNFSEKNLLFLDEVGDTILPTTAASPGAKTAKIAQFMKTFVTDCYEKRDQETFMEGIGLLNKVADQKWGKSFVDLEHQQKHDLLVALDKEASEYQDKRKDGEPAHYFTLMKQLTLLGYFTSQEGAKQALRYLPVPGGYQGCIDYKKGDKAWAI